MKKALTLLILLLGISISSQAQPASVYNIKAASYLNENKLWTEFKPIDGTVSINKDEVTVSVPSLEFNVSWNLKVEGKQTLDNGDVALIMSSTAENDESSFGLIYCVHQNTLVFRVVIPTTGLQFIISKGQSSSTNLNFL